MYAECLIISFSSYFYIILCHNDTYFGHLGRTQGPFGHWHEYFIIKGVAGQQTAQTNKLSLTNKK